MCSIREARFREGTRAMWRCERRYIGRSIVRIPFSLTMKR